MRFHVFAHVIAQELHAHSLGQPAGQLRLAHAGGAIEKEGARGPLTLPQARARTQDGAHGLLHGFFLPEDDLLEVLFQIGQAVPLLARDRPYGHTGHAGHDAFHVGHRDGGHPFFILAAQVNGGPHFVHHVDGLVRLQTVTDIPVGKVHDAAQHGLAVTHAVMARVMGLQAVEDGKAVLGIGFPHVDTLEAPCQGPVFFQMVAELLMGGGADAAQLPAGQHGLEQVGSVHGTAGSGPGPHDGMDLVDEDHRIRDVLELFHDGLETAFELTAIAGTGQDQAHIEGVDLDVLELFGDLPLGDAQGQTFGQCGLAHTGIAHEQGIVLAAAAQDLDGPVQLFLTSHQGIDLAVTGTGGELGGVFFQDILPGLALFLLPGGIGGHAPGSAPFRHTVRDEGQRVQTVHSLTRQEVVSVAVLFIQDGHEQVAQFHLAPSRSVDVPQGPFEHPLHTGGLVDFVLALIRQHLHLVTEKAFQLFAQHRHTGPAAFQQQAAGSHGRQ